MMCLQLLRAYAKDRRGVTAVLVALVMPVIIISSGIAYDIAAAYNVRNRLTNAVDKSALAVAASDGTLQELEDVMNKFFEANFPDKKLGEKLNIKLTLDGNKVIVEGRVMSENTFMRIVGQDFLVVYAKASVVRELSGVEAVLVLDVTGSMSEDNRLVELKRASKDFLNIMFPDPYSPPEKVKVGIVPYSNAVNVGPFGLGKDFNNNNYDTAFVNRPSSDPYTSSPSSIAYTSSNSNTTTAWRGCVLARSSGGDVVDTASPKWGMYRYPKACLATDRYGRCTTTNANPNYLCPTARIVPLTNNVTRLTNTIDSLQAAGNTYGNLGMVWGWRVLSPEYPFKEGVAWNDEEWTKVIIMMTDGNNLAHPQYSAYGTSTSSTPSNTALNDKFETICQNAKAKGAIIYTITLSSDINNRTKDYYRACASDSAKYYDVKDAEELRPVFRSIASQLSQLHITE